MNISRDTCYPNTVPLWRSHDRHTSTRSNKGVTYELDISTEILRNVLCLFAKSPRSTPGEAQLLCRYTANIKTLRPIIRYVNVWTRDISKRCVLVQSVPRLSLVLSRRLQSDVTLLTSFILFRVSVCCLHRSLNFGSFLSVLMMMSVCNNTGVSKTYILSPVSA
jgi:hypothetical protein